MSNSSNETTLAARDVAEAFQKLLDIYERDIESVDRPGWIVHAAMAAERLLEAPSTPPSAKERSAPTNLDEVRRFAEIVEYDKWNRQTALALVKQSRAMADEIEALREVAKLCAPIRRYIETVGSAPDAAVPLCHTDSKNGDVTVSFKELRALVAALKKAGM